MPTSSSSSIVRLRACRAIHALVELERLADLSTDGQHGVQRGHRVLEDHGDVVAAHLAHVVLLELEQVAAVEHHLAADDPAGRLRNQPHQRQRADALAATRLADQAERLALVQRERDAVDGLDHPVLGEELRPKVLNLQQRTLYRGLQRHGARSCSSG